MQVEIRSLQPEKNFHDTGETWQVNALPAYFECNTNKKKWPKGWVAVKAQMFRQCNGFETNLLLKLDTGKTIKLGLPVTLKGKVFEFVYFPKGVVKVYFEPMTSTGRFQLQSLEFKPVLWVVRNYFMYRRLYHISKSQKPDVIYKAGIRWYHLFLNLSKAYKIAGRFRAYSPKIEYQEWLGLFDRLNEKDILKINKLIKRFKKLPSIQLAKVGGDKDSLLNKWSIERLLGDQVYKNYSCIKAGSANNLAKWVLLIEPSVKLRPHALFCFAYHAVKNSDVAFIYSDHDFVDDNGIRIDPQFKPQWSPELFLAQNYLGGALLINTEKVYVDLKLNKSIFEIVLGVFERTHPLKTNGLLVHRIPSLLYSQFDHRSNSFWSSQLQINKQHIETEFEFNKVSADIVTIDNKFLQVKYLPKTTPLVSIVVPTRDMLQHLKRCIGSILEKTSYLNFEIIIVDNQSEKKETIKYLDKISQNPKVTVLNYNFAFNYSKINNFAVSQSNGDYICLLNNDTEVISRDWLEVMVGQIQQPNVGAVGIKLLYPNNTVQHAGDAVGPGGCADHYFSGFGEDEPGYMGRAIMAQDLSAVTAACLLTSRVIYDEVGGLDEDNLEVAFNDVDYCLKVGESGRRVVFTPYAKMYHYESLSRGQDLTPEKIERAKREADFMRGRWANVMADDPFYNPNLNYSRPNFELSRFPMVRKPWLKR